MKVNKGAAETLLTCAGKTAEDFVKLKLGELAKLPFILKERKTSLTEAELKAPNRELAYWLYAGSGFLLKAARRFDIGFQWFNRHADIEKKPLQSIGLVAGCIIAVIYWSVALLHRLL